MREHNSQVHVVYAYMNQGLFLNILASRKICWSKFSFKKPVPTIFCWSTWGSLLKIPVSFYTFALIFGV